MGIVKRSFQCLNKRQRALNILCGFKGIEEGSWAMERPIDEQAITGTLKKMGAALVGFADLSGFADDGLNTGVSIIVSLDAGVIRGIENGPTRAYFDLYHSANRKLDTLALACSDMIKDFGYDSFAQTTDAVREFGVYQTRMPHKTVAVRSGLGWIGKSALLVTREFGPAVRLTSVLTDAPLTAGIPIEESKCGGCTACADACPARAISGKLWSKDLFRDEFYDPLACRKKARELAWKRIGKEITLCGKCIEVCPYTQRYLEGTCL